MNKFFNIILIISFLIGSLFISSRSYAINMDSSRYRIQFGNINIGANNQSSSSFDLTTTLGQPVAGEFQSDGYIVKAGFQYLHSIIPFSFSISNTDIDFGTLTSNTPVTQTTDLTVSFGAAGQYQVTAVEEGPLVTMQGIIIPDTICDGEANTCSETLAKPWLSNSSYGFGYNVKGQDVPLDFLNANYFRPFPDNILDETPATVMKSINVGKNRQATVTFKTNISPIQPAGTYHTIISFVATPSF